MVESYVVLKTKLLVVSVSTSARIWEAFSELKVQASSSNMSQRVPSLILRSLSYQDCKYYKLNVPVPLPSVQMNHAEVIQQCLNESN